MNYELFNFDDFAYKLNAFILYLKLALLYIYILL